MRPLRVYSVTRCCVLVHDVGLNLRKLLSINHCLFYFPLLNRKSRYLRSLTPKVWIYSRFSSWKSPLVFSSFSDLYPLASPKLVTREKKEGGWYLYAGRMHTVPTVFVCECVVGLGGGIVSSACTNSSGVEIRARWNASVRVAHKFPHAAAGAHVPTQTQRCSNTYE